MKLVYPYISEVKKLDTINFIIIAVVNYEFIFKIILKIGNKKMSDKRYKFTLYGFNINKFWKEYSSLNFQLKDEDVEEYGFDNEKLTTIYYTDNLLHKDSPNYIRYLGRNNTKHKLWIVNMSLMRNTSLSSNTNLRCRNCHHTFTSAPFGCPYQYVNTSENTIKNNEIIKKLKIKNYIFDKNSDFFITQKIYCGLSCVLSKILKKRKKDPIYERYLTLFTLLVQKIEKIMGKKLNIHPAPDIETLTCYGGHLSIEEFRNMNGQLIYSPSKNIENPLFFPAGNIIEEMQGSKFV